MKHEQDGSFLALKELLLKEHLTNFQNLAIQVEKLENNYTDKQYIQNQLTPIIDELIENNIKEKIIIKDHLHKLVEDKIQEDIIGNKETFTHIFEPFISESLTKYFKRHMLKIIHSKIFQALVLGLLALLFIYIGMSVYRYFVPSPFEAFKTALIKDINHDRSLSVYDLSVIQQNDNYVIEGKVRDKADILAVDKRVHAIGKNAKVLNMLTLLHPLISHEQIEKNLRIILKMFNQLQKTKVSLRYHKSIRQLMVMGVIESEKQKTILINALKKIKGIKTIMIDIQYGIQKERIPKVKEKDITKELKDLVNTAPKHFPLPTKGVVKEPKL